MPARNVRTLGLLSAMRRQKAYWVNRIAPFGTSADYSTQRDFRQYSMKYSENQSWERPTRRQSTD
jgi:hypothetical protein